MVLCGFRKGSLKDRGMVVNTQHTLSLIKLQVALVCALANIKKPLMEADFRNDNYKKKNVQQQRKLTQIESIHNPLLLDYISLFSPFAKSSFPRRRELTPDENLGISFCFPFFSKESLFLAMLAKYWITFFVFSVLPAPDSPLASQSEGESQENVRR